MLNPKPTPDQCPSHHDPYTFVLTLGLISGLVVSYLPQHFRIISKGTSEGLSPWFLMLGATSSASGMLNLLIVQWPAFQCCRVVSGGQCFESLLAFFQVFIQWFLFSVMFILYLIYFPTVPRMSLAEPVYGESAYGAVLDFNDGVGNRNGNGDAHANGNGDVAVDSDVQLERAEEQHAIADALAYQSAIQANKVEWRSALLCAWVTLIHLIVVYIVAQVLLEVLPNTRPQHPALRNLAKFCGLTGTILAICQYAPQIYKTFKAGLVGALSIGTMLIQVPGSVLFCVSIALRDGTDWTSWMPYAVTGAMQFCLLVICFCWKARQKRLGVDDFGNPILRDIVDEVEVDESTALLSNRD